MFTERFCPNCGNPNPIVHIDETLKVEPIWRTGHGIGNARPAAIIATVATIGILVVSFISSSYSLNGLQFHVNKVSVFDYASLSSAVQINVCNPSVFPTSFDKYNIVIHYRGKDFASMSVNGGMLMPRQTVQFDGKLKLDSQLVSGLIVAFADAVAGRDTAYNTQDISLTTTVDAKLLGVFPYTQTREITFSEFQQVIC